MSIVIILAEQDGKETEKQGDTDKNEKHWAVAAASAVDYQVL